MPPRVRLPARNQAESRDFDEDRFWGYQANRKYDTTWIYKPVVNERRWLIDQFQSEEFLLFQNFERRQWLHLTKFTPRCVVEVVREFFANAKAESINRGRGVETITSWVRGVEITLTPTDFAQVFQLPRVHQPEFHYPFDGVPPIEVIAPEILKEDCTWVGELRKPISELNDKYWPLHMFSCTNLLPQNRNSDCTPLRAKLIYAIGKGLTIDLPTYMWRQILYTFEHPNTPTGIPFGGALTQIFRNKGAHISEDLPIASCLLPITYTSLLKSRGLLIKKRKLKNQNEEGSSSQVEEEHSAETTIEDLADKLDETTSAIGDLSERMSQLEYSEEQNSRILQQLLRNQEEQGRWMQHFFSHFPGYQPPFPPPQ